MSGELHFLDIDGVEIANSYRTLSYLRRGLGPAGLQKFEVGSLGCAVLGREVGGVAPFVSPSIDPAPWYDAAIPESAEFLGLILKLDFQTLDVRRSVSQRFGNIGGGVIGVPQLAARGLKGESMLIASSCPGLEYGRHWLYGKLGVDCAGCGLYVVRVRDSCPPDDGSNDTRGEWLMYEAALVEGITRSDILDGCCDYEGLEFTIASQSPYLYKRASAASAPVAIGNSGGFAPLLPAVIDTFVRANTGPPPSGSWTGSTRILEGNTLRVLSNVLDNSVHTIGTTGSAHWNAATFGPDVAVTIVVPTRVNSGSFAIRARIVNPTLATVSYINAQIRFLAAAGTDSVTLGRAGGTSDALGSWSVESALGQYASGDTFMLTCRGNLIEVWRKPSGGAWVRLCSGYDEVAPVAGNVGVAIVELGATQTLGAFGAATLTNGALYPSDVITNLLPAQSIGVLAPIITLVSTRFSGVGEPLSAHGVRMQLSSPTGGECSQVDAFGTNNLATRWTGFPNPAATDYTITGGKLKPLVTGLSGGSFERRVFRRDALAAAIAWPGGKISATIRTGASVTNGGWGLTFGLNIGVYLIRTVGATSNVFAFSNAANGTYGLDSVAFTPLVSTTYRIVFELAPTAIAGQYTATAWLVDEATGILLARPITSIVGVLNALGPTFQPAISSVPAGTDEEWDSFYAIDNTDAAAYMEANFDRGTLIIDSPRRVVEFTPSGSAVSEEGSGQISTPIDTPLGWPDVCAGDGAACLQVWASEVASPGTTFAYATQQRVR